MPNTAGIINTKSCYVIDVKTAGVVLHSIIPLVRENLSSLPTGHTYSSVIRDIQARDNRYTHADVTAAENFITQMLSEPTDISAATDALEAQPLAYALVNDVLNQGAGAGMRPQHKLILHCELGEAPNCNEILTHDPAKKRMLEDNVKKHIRDITGPELDVLYLFGHGGDVGGQHNLTTQMASISGDVWRDIFSELNAREVHAKSILVDSCYSAAFSPELTKILTDDGVMLLDSIEATPIHSLEAAVKISKGDLHGPLFTLEQIESLEAQAKALLTNLGMPSTDSDLLTSTADALSKIICSKDEPSSPYTEAELIASTGINDLITASENSDSAVTLDDVIAVSAKLPAGFDLWNYFNETLMQTRAVDSITRFKAEVKSALLGQGINEPKATNLSNAYVEATRAYISTLFRSKPEDTQAAIRRSGLNITYPQKPDELMLRQGHQFAGYHETAKCDPPVRVLLSRAERLIDILRTLQAERDVSIAKVVMTKNEALLIQGARLPPNANSEDGPPRMLSTTLSIMLALKNSSFSSDNINIHIRGIAGGKREALIQFNTYAAQAFRLPDLGNDVYALDAPVAVTPLVEATDTSAELLQVQTLTTVSELAEGPALVPDSTSADAAATMRTQLKDIKREAEPPLIPGDTPTIKGS